MTEHGGTRAAGKTKRSPEKSEDAGTVRIGIRLRRHVRAKAVVSKEEEHPVFRGAPPVLPKTLQKR
jgi:hypothetical protein